MTGVAPLVERLEPADDPAELAAALLDLPYLIFLDSATGLAAGEPHHLGRYSFLSADPVLVVRSKGQVTEVIENGRGRRVAGDALGVAARSCMIGRRRRAGLPPFQGAPPAISATTMEPCSSGCRPRGTTTWPSPTWCSGSTIGSSRGTTARARHG